MNTPTPTPRSKIILDHIKIYVEADNAAQSYAHYEEVNREIESMEAELTAAREELDKWEQIAHDKLSEICRQIEKTRVVTEQRDRLAEALERIGEEDGSPMSMRVCSTKSLVKQALQSLNQDHTVATNDMIAAVKGDNHES